MGSIADRIQARQTKQNQVGSGQIVKSAPPKPKRPRDPFFSGLQHSAEELAKNVTTLMDERRKEQKRMERAKMSRMEDWEANQTHTKMKYIVVDHPKAGIIAQTFHGCLIHAEMARASYLREGEVLGAGFYAVSIDATGDVEVHVYGRSESLNIGSRPEDAEYIEKQLGLA